MLASRAHAAPVALLLAALLAPTPLRGDDLLAQLGDAARNGRLEAEARLREGSVPVLKGYSVTVKGAPATRLDVAVREGKLEALRYTAPDDALLLVGRGLRPDVVLTRIETDPTGTITDLDFHGRGLGKLVVGLFRPLVRKKVRQLKLHTELAELFRGNVVVAASKEAPAPAAPVPVERETAEPVSGPGAASVVPQTGFLDLVEEVRLLELRLSAYPGKPLWFGETLVLETGGEDGGDPIEVRLDEALYRPGRDGAEAEWTAKGRLEGTLGAGSVALEDGKVAFRSAALLGGRFAAEKKGDTPLSTSLRAGRFDLSLAKSQLRLPGGIDVAVEDGSRFGVSSLVLEPTGAYRGRIDFRLLGGTGEIRHEGERLSLSGATISSGGLDVRDGRATGPLSLDFDYHLVHPFVVKYPGDAQPPKTVPLDFRGPFSARLRLADAGAGGGGSVTGEYSLKIPWKPVEQAAIEALKAQWTQDVKVVRKVDFTIEPRSFGPCGPQCFGASFAFTAEKKRGERSLFRQLCEPEGTAELVVDPAARSFVLKNLQVKPRCKGAVGWFVNLVAPLLTKTYSDMTLFQLPPDLPFSIETVRSGNDFVRIDGEVSWKGTSSPPAVAPLD
ncbi:MAG: hypothetical protein KBB14_18210 [Thermoanaerobaculia bacterium]|nr:hypothetical protein [Thermoanaerobaculia bacterium]